MASILLKEIFEQEGQLVTNLLKDSLDKNKVNATGNLKRSIKYEATEDRLVVSSLLYGLTSETGRGPTKQSQGGVLFRQILKWLDDKGIPEKEEMSRRTQAFLITRSIHERGTKAFREGRKTGVLSDIINSDEIDNLVVRIIAETQQAAVDTIVFLSPEDREFLRIE